MAGATQKSFDSPDESRTPPKTKMDIVDLGGAKAARLTAEPGWKWSECIKPVAGTDSCQSRHLGVVASGTMHVVHDDGTEIDINAGDAYTIDPGHDAWVVGNDTFVGYEFDTSAAASYAKPS
jgi:hypothetical protein